jgi:hypothetical protein
MTMSDPLDFPYATFLDIKFAPLTVVDVPPLVRDCKDQWYNQTLCKVNDSVIRLGVMQGEYHWHKHDSDDEFFFVLDGHFIIDLEDRSVDLQLEPISISPVSRVVAPTARREDIVPQVEVDLRPRQDVFSPTVRAATHEGYLFI